MSPEIVDNYLLQELMTSTFIYYTHSFINMNLNDRCKILEGGVNQHWNGECVCEGKGWVREGLEGRGVGDMHCAWNVCIIAWAGSLGHTHNHSQLADRRGWRRPACVVGTLWVVTQAPTTRNPSPASLSRRRRSTSAPSVISCSIDRKNNIETVEVRSRWAEGDWIKQLDCAVSRTYISVYYLWCVYSFWTQGGQLSSISLLSLIR